MSRTPRPDLAAGLAAPAGPAADLGRTGLAPAFAALVVGALAMGLSPVLVRLVSPEVGPFASAFWRVALALPALYGWMRWEEARAPHLRRALTPSVLLAGMAGSRMPIAVAHGEGRVSDTADRIQALAGSGLVALGYVGEQYPQNPNGSPFGITGVTTRDGRATIVMPHPERVFRAVQHSWRPAAWTEDGSWIRLFRNARVFVG